MLLPLFLLRDRPFNLQGGGRGMVFCFVQKFFFGHHESLNIYFLLSRKARIFFPEFNIGLYDKISESDYFFFLHQNQNIFFSSIGVMVFFRKKNITPPPPPLTLWKLNGPSLNHLRIKRNVQLISVHQHYCKNDQTILYQDGHMIWHFHTYYELF